MILGKILIFLGAFGMLGVFLAKGFTDSERWIILIFCMVIIIIGVLVNSKIGHLFKETYAYTEER